ncbi:MAG: NADH-quinone oxidoreductase subunit M, partial [Desulfocucumaceae bacterium]
MSGFPFLTTILLAPVAAALIMIFLPRDEGKLIKLVAAVGTFVSLALSLYVYFTYDQSIGGLQFAEQIPWIRDLGVSYFL